MFSKNLIFSAAIGALICTSCATSSIQESDSSIMVDPNDSLDAKIEKLRKKRDYFKARIYEETDESMRTEYNTSWEDYRGHLGKQEFFEQRLKQIDAEIEALEKNKVKSRK